MATFDFARKGGEVNAIWILASIDNISNTMCVLLDLAHAIPDSLVLRALLVVLGNLCIVLSGDRNSDDMMSMKTSAGNEV